MNTLLSFVPPPGWVAHRWQHQADDLRHYLAHPQPQPLVVLPPEAYDEPSYSPFRELCFPPMPRPVRLDVVRAVGLAPWTGEPYAYAWWVLDLAGEPVAAGEAERVPSRR